MNKGASLSGPPAPGRALFLVHSPLFISILILINLAAAHAQSLQREWVRNYSSSLSGTNQAIAVAIAPDGNAVVGGTSQNQAGDLDYVVIKYKPNGDELWRVRHDSIGQGNDQLRALAIDPIGNIIVTGTSDTVKLSGAGTLLWFVPLPGRAVVADTNYVYVAGFSDTDFSTAQLENNDFDGQELWRRTIDGQAHGPDISQVMTLDGAGNVYVAGQFDDRGCSGLFCFRGFAVVSYRPDGSQRWLGKNPFQMDARSVQANSILVLPNGTAWVYGTYGQNTVGYISRFEADGRNSWNSFNGAETGTKMLFDEATQKLFMTGRQRHEGSGANQQVFVTKFNASGTNSASASFEQIWSYLAESGGLNEGIDIKKDSAGNIFITGYSDINVGDTTKAMLLAKVSPAGQQLGLDRYKSPNAGSNFGTALAIDKNDNVYVTGYVLNTQGGSEFVTIKYAAAPKIEKKPNGAMHIEFHTLPGQQYSLEASTNFLNWENLITQTADSNGLIQFDDTNAPTIPYRFYRGYYFP